MNHRGACAYLLGKVVFGLTLATALISGCATTSVTQRRIENPNAKIARPDRIIVPDFLASPADLPDDSALAGRYTEPSEPMTAEQLAVARELGASVAKDLISDIRAMGLTAVPALGQRPPRVGDIVIRGAFVSVDEGSAGKRIVIGFGAGGAELQTFVEGYLMTQQGLRRLGSGEVSSGTKKTPGMAAPLLITLATSNPIGIVVGGSVKAYGELTGSDKIEGAGKRTAEEIAKQMRLRFEQQGWIARE